MLADSLRLLDALEAQSIRDHEAGCVSMPAAAAAAAETRVKCVVRDGMFVEPCEALERNTDIAQAGFSKAKGIARWSYVNMETHKPSRSFFGVKTKSNPDGFLFNFCPFCGEDISTPFVEKDTPQ